MIMDKDLLYFGIGILATILVGIWGIRFSKILSVKKKLSFFNKGVIPLFKSVVKDLDELEIKYKGDTIKKNLMIFKGTFYNSGNADIDKNTIYKPVSVILPDGYYWRNVSIEDKSDSVNVTFEIENNILFFRWDIFQKEEMFTFESIVEYLPNEDIIKDSYLEIEMFIKRIKFAHRITDLPSVKIENNTTDLFHKFFIKPLLFIPVFLMLFFYVDANPFMNATKVYVKISDINDSYLQIPMIKNSDIKIFNSSYEISKTINYSELCSIGLNDNIKIVTSDNTILINNIFKWVLIMYVIILIISSLSLSWKKYVMYKKMKIITAKSFLEYYFFLNN